ncbi:hypothetical protein [Shimia haliotis]|uniref:Uncharacterized protein n=1 Tax=Shimia haliotis TaxID=1280847 RepID=A0A1I4DSY8_9RHOB|nr:hypothetical protein [Shimia haliotis]SFK95367.1 hypothetical protein SAMN04488036_103339 [Shimia haliotis]
MNPWMILASALLGLTTYVHVFLGGPEIHHVIQASSLSGSVRGVAAVLWHAVTVVLIAFALACAVMARHQNRALALLVIGIQLGFAALFVVYGLSLLGTLWVMPQWLIFTLIPAVMMCGLRWGQRGNDRGAALT